MLEELLQLDREILVYVNGLGSETYDPIWIALTSAIYWLPLFFWVAYTLVQNTPKQQLLQFGLELMLLILVIQLTVLAVKLNTMRLRPINDPSVQGSLRRLISSSSYSFFSGHAATSFAVATFVYLVGRTYTKHVALLFIWALFFTYSRLYLGVHYLSDIVVGISAGMLFGIAFYRIHNIISKKIRYS